MYLTCISLKPTRLEREALIGWFNNQADFKAEHNNSGDIIDLEKWLEI